MHKSPKIYRRIVYVQQALTFADSFFDKLRPHAPRAQGRMTSNLRQSQRKICAKIAQIARRTVARRAYLCDYYGTGFLRGRGATVDATRRVS